MDERRMLELAAKAAGIEGSYFHSDNPIHCGIYQARGEYYWNPLISDSEALRLGATLTMSLQYRKVVGSGTGEVAAQIGDCHAVEGYRDDYMAATRRCIVRAAAAIGEQMKG